MEAPPRLRRRAVAQQTGTSVASGLVESSHRPRWGAKRPWWRQMWCIRHSSAPGFGAAAQSNAGGATIRQARSPQECARL